MRKIIPIHPRQLYFSCGRFRWRFFCDEHRGVAAVADSKVPLIASSQSTDIRVCIEICNFCEDCGYDCVQISGPYYYDGRPGDAMAWMQQVAKYTDVGFALYNNWYTGYDMPIDLIDEMLEIKNSVAVKWGSLSVFTYMEGIHRFSPKAVVVDNALLPVDDLQNS